MMVGCGHCFPIDVDVCVYMPLSCPRFCEIREMLDLHFVIGGWLVFVIDSCLFLHDVKEPHCWR